jgi:hypothetical protein
MNIDQMHVAVKAGLDKTEGLSYAAFETEELDFWLNEAIDRFVKTRYSGTNVKGESFEQSQKRTDDLRTLVVEARIVPAAGAGVTDKPYSYTVGISNFPTDYLLFLNDEVSIVFNHEVTGVSTTLRTYPVACTSDTYSSKVNDIHSEHRLHLSTARPLRMFTAKGVELITDNNYTIPFYYMKYLRKPARVNYALTASQTTATSNIVDGIVYDVSGNTVTYNGVTYNIGGYFTGVIGVTSFTGTGTATPRLAHCDLPEHTHREIVLLTVKILTENIESPRYQTESIELTQSE